MESVRIFGDRISLFKQPKSENWFARFYVDRARKVTTTLKTSDFNEASKRAEDWYVAALGAIKNGTKPAQVQPHAQPGKRYGATSFKAVSDMALEQYRTDGHSAQYVNGLRKVFNRLAEYVGSDEIGTVKQATWSRIKDNARKEGVSFKTQKQWKNAVMVVVKFAYERELIPEPVPFLREYTPKSEKRDTHRIWFDEDEYRKLKDGLRENVRLMKKANNGHVEDAEELRDFCLWMSNTGFRISEARNVKFCDVIFAKEKDVKTGKVREVLHISNISGKTGNGGVAKSYFGAPYVFRRIIARHELTEQNYHTSRDCIWKAYHREMFKALLIRLGLYETNDSPPRRRDLMCLRHTFICMALRRKVGIRAVARMCRTSVAMIEQHYAKHLSILNDPDINQDYREEDE